MFDERIRHALHGRLAQYPPARPAQKRFRHASALEEIERALEEGLHADRWQLFGELILAFGHTLEPDATKLLAPDYTHPDMPTIEIPIDPTRSVVENAERYFQKARRAREHQNELAQRYGILSEEAEALRLALERTENAHTETDLRPILEEARARGWLRETAPLHPAKRAEKDPFEGHRIRVHLSPDGYQVLVGENAEANDYLLTAWRAPQRLVAPTLRAGTGSA